VGHLQGKDYGKQSDPSGLRPLLDSTFLVRNCCCAALAIAMEHSEEAFSAV